MGSVNSPDRESVAVESPNAVSDETLVLRALAGEKKAFDSLVLKYQRQAIAVSYRLLGNAHDAQEIVQDALLKAYQNLATLQKPGAFGGWLMRIVSNLSLNARRTRGTRGSPQEIPNSNLWTPPRNKANQRLLSDYQQAESDPAAIVGDHEMGERITAVIQELPDAQRACLVLQQLEGNSQRDIASLLGTSVESVKWNVMQSRDKFEESMPEEIRRKRARNQHSYNHLLSA